MAVDITVLMLCPCLSTVRSKEREIRIYPMDTIADF